MNDNDYKKQFFNFLQDLTEENDIKRELPNPELDYFNELMNYIIEKQNEYVKDCREALNLAINHDENEEYGKYLEIAEKQQRIYLTHLNNRIKKDVSDDKQENCNFREVLYAESNEKILFEKNLKDLLKNDNGERLEGFNQLIINLKNNDVNFNQQKSKKLTNHTELKDVFELKAFQIRLFYMYVDKYAVVIGACEKKTDNSEMIRKKIINMKYSSIEYRKLLEDNLKNKKFIEDELEKSRNFEKNIMKGKSR